MLVVKCLWYVAAVLHFISTASVLSNGKKFLFLGEDHVQTHAFLQY